MCVFFLVMTFVISIVVGVFLSALCLIALIYNIDKRLESKKGSFIRYKGRIQRIVLSDWHIGGNKVSLYTLDLSKINQFKKIDLSEIDGDLSTVQALKYTYSLPPVFLSFRSIPVCIENVDLLSNLKVLEIKTVQVEKTIDLNSLKRLFELEVLILSLKTITKITGLENFSKLQVLNLSRNKIKKIEGLKNLKNLKVLDLSYNEITQITGLEKLTKLEKIHLNHNQIASIKDLRDLPNLKELILNNNKITEIKNLESLVNLEILDLSFNKINKVKGLSDLKKLHWLSVNNNPIYEQARKQFDTTKFSNFKNPQDLVMYCWKNEKAREEAIEYIKKLPSIYDDITFYELESKTKLDVNDLKPIIEEMIYSSQIKAKITGDSIFFGKEKNFSNISFENKKIPQISNQDISVRKNKSRVQLKVFLSYSTLDSPYFQISHIAKALESYPEIEKILYWEADSSENIVAYMERTLKECSVFILFCTENALNSQAVTDEWQAAFQLRKKGQLKILPVYEDEEFIPALLTPLLNVRFSKDNIIDFVLNLRQEILRK